MSDAVRNNDFGNSTSRLPREKILAELKDLDQDFQGLNPDISNVIPEYRPVIGNPRIHFVLKDIVYKKVSSKQISAANNSSSFRRLSPMQEPERYLNVYISRLKVNGGGSEGVTNVPSEAVDFSNDGVNLNFAWVGLHYRLLSHEVGHWLGLWHVDNEDQIDVTNVTDIPVQNKLTDKECMMCSNPKVKVIKHQRQQFVSPNYNNYMDYSGCRSMFSLQQAAAMRNQIIRLRKQIWN